MPIKPIFSDQYFPFGDAIEYLSSRPFLYFLSVEILIAGAWTESVWGNDFFSRSGAILALLALAILWLWLHYSNEERDIEELNSLLQNKVLGNVDANDLGAVQMHIRRTNPNQSIEDQSWRARKIHERLSLGTELNVELSKVNKRLSFAQIEIAAIGTTVWAFGDLLFQVCK